MLFLVPIAIAAPDWTTHDPMTAPPAALLEAARGAAPDEHGARVLLDETTLRLAPGGLATFEFHRVFVITTRAGVDEWGMLGAGYASWFERPPKIAARVITPDGRVHTLDPAHVSDAVDRGQDGMLSDRHSVRAPLPALTVGAVVEQHVVVEQHAPYFEAGGVTSLPIGSPWPIDRRRVQVIAAPEVDFTWRVWPPELAPEVGRHKGARTVTIDLDGRTFEEVPWEPDRPDDEPVSALVVSTARDWQSVASAYSALVEAELASVDLAERAASARGDATAREEVIARLLAHVRELRYVAVELGASAIRPRSPAIAFRNGYGDCKDKALALVGLLRASGIDADTALVRVGPGPDVAPLPGLDEFDHMIVYVPGESPLWIDPTNDFLPVGDLPLGDQGRKALIVDPATRDLVETPVLPSSRSVHRFAREVRFAERGPGAVHEQQTLTGWVADSARWAHTAITPEQLESWYAERAATEFRGTLEGGVRITDADPSRLVIDLEIAGAGTAIAAEDDASALLGAWDVLQWLPDWLLAAPEPGAPPRRSPVALAPYSAEIVQRMAPPPGLVIDAEPEPFARTFGPVSWTQQVAHEPDGAVVATVRFDTGSGRLAADEAQALREAIAAYAQEERGMFVFRHPAAVAFSQGRVGEALGHARDAVTARPDDPRVRDRFARTLLASGFGHAAVDEALRAAEAAPTDAALARNLGFALLHDRFGRLVGPGFDRAAAVAAIERAIALEPGEPWAWQMLAIAWEAGDDGVLYGPGSDVGRSIEALRERRARTGATDLDHVIAHHLAHAGRWDELATHVETLGAEHRPLRFRILHAAATGGADAALAVPTARAAPEEVREGLVLAATERFRRRDYPGAARLLDAAAKRVDDPTALAPLVQTIARMRPTEELALASDDPVGVVRQVLAAEPRRPSEKEARRWAAHGFEDELFHTDDAPDAEPLPLPLGLGTLPMTPAHTADFVLATIECRSEGSAALGWRVTCTRPGSDARWTWYLVEEKGAPKVRATWRTVDEVGAEAAARLARGDEAGGRQWLEWLRALGAPPRDASDPHDGSVFVRLMAHDPAAAALAATVTDEEHARAAIRGLERALAAATDPVIRGAIEVALLGAYGEIEAWDDAFALATRHQRDWPTNAAALEWLGFVAHRARKAADVLPAVRAVVEAHPERPELHRIFADLAASAGRHADAQAAFVRVLELGQATARDYNEAAWLALLDPGPPSEQVLGWAQRSNEIGRFRNAANVHTLATALVAAGRADEARQLLIKGLEVDDDPDQVEAWVYLQGRLAEAWGLPDVARALYGELPAPDAKTRRTHVRALARERLNALGAE